LGKHARDHDYTVYINVNGGYMSELIYPKTYYYRGGVSDKKFVLDKMAYIPDEKNKRLQTNMKGFSQSLKTEEERLMST